jgi:divalent metal cation (Fe/Co/Zn/Cd) transporter
MFWSVAFAVTLGILMARALRKSLVTFISLSVGLSIVVAFFNPPLALTFMALAVLAFLFYVTSKTAWKGAFSSIPEEPAPSAEVTLRGIMRRLF